MSATDHKVCVNPPEIRTLGSEGTGAADAAVCIGKRRSCAVGTPSFFASRQEEADVFGEKKLVFLGSVVNPEFLIAVLCGVRIFVDYWKYLL